MNGDPVMHQISRERAAVDAMYRRLDHEVADAREAHRQALAKSVEGPQELVERDAEIGRLTRLIRERRAAERSLCFGRIDSATGESMHIGRIGLRDQTGERLLVDWRADAARPFYAATALAAQGLRRRRHLRLEGRTVVGVSDELLDGSPETEEDAVGDGPLAEALGQARTGRMREAVSTLQSEQDAIVRSAHRGVTVVQGGPGTGKTIVALHRAAYLLYAFPRAAERGVLVYGPNHRFLDYISEVLPSLGEDQVKLATAVELIGVEPACTDTPVIAERKGQADIAAALAAWVRGHQPHGMPLTVPVGQDTLTLDASVIDRARRTALKDAGAHNPARERFVEYVVEELVDLMEQSAAETLEMIDDEVASVLGLDLDRPTAADLHKLGFEHGPRSEGLPGFDREGIRSSLIEDPGLDTIVERIWPRLEPLTVLHQFLTDQDILIRLWPAATAGQRRQLAERSSSELSAADLPLLDEVRELISGAGEQLFGHVVIDEAQELTEMEWRTLMRRCPSRSMTVVGDLAQRGSLTTVRSWEAALQPFVAERFQKHTLTVNYRTTEEILRESAPLLAELAPEQELSRSIRRGDSPRMSAVSRGGMIGSLVRLVGQVREERPGELIGVICPQTYVGALQDELGSTTDDDAAVVAAAEVRGLEFDTAILVDPAAIRTDRTLGAHDLYVAMTRATKRLLVVEITRAT